MKTKKLFRIALLLLLFAVLAACRAGTDSEAPQTQAADTAAGVTAAADTAAGGAEPAESASERVLVAVFSATGTTRSVAEKIAAITGGDLYEIQAANPYTDADLNWHDSKSRTSVEQNDKSVRPEIAGEPISLDGYTTIYVGFPIWWGEEPRILDTFVESYDFTGITMIPFCTSSSSGLGRSGKNLEEHAQSGVWLDGKRFAGGVSEKELRAWIEGLK